MSKATHPIDSSHPVDPSIARQREQIAAEKAEKGTDEKRELAGEGEFAHQEGERKLNINAALENPLTGISHERLEGKSTFSHTTELNLTLSCAVSHGSSVLTGEGIGSIRT